VSSRLRLHGKGASVVADASPTARQPHRCVSAYVVQQQKLQDRSPTAIAPRRYSRPLLFGQHLSRKSVFDCDPIQKDAKHVFGNLAAQLTPVRL
jgi:hypothetical protein